MNVKQRDHSLYFQALSTPFILIVLMDKENGYLLLSFLGDIFGSLFFKNFLFKKKHFLVLVLNTNL